MIYQIIALIKYLQLQIIVIDRLMINKMNGNGNENERTFWGLEYYFGFEWVLGRR